MAAMGPLVSEAPRPQRRLSRISPEKGSMVMPTTPTVSRWGPRRMRGRPSSGAKRAMRLGRPGLISSRVTVAPRDSSQPVRKLAISASPV